MDQGEGSLDHTNDALDQGNDAVLDHVSDQVDPHDEEENEDDDAPQDEEDAEDDDAPQDHSDEEDGQDNSPQQGPSRRVTRSMTARQQVHQEGSSGESNETVLIGSRSGRGMHRGGRGMRGNGRRSTRRNAN